MICGCGHVAASTRWRCASYWRPHRRTTPCGKVSSTNSRAETRRLIFDRFGHYWYDVGSVRGSPGWYCSQSLKVIHRDRRQVWYGHRQCPPGREIARLLGNGTKPNNASKPPCCCTRRSASRLASPGLLDRANRAMGESVSEVRHQKGARCWQGRLDFGEGLLALSTSARLIACSVHSRRHGKRFALSLKIVAHIASGCCCAVCHGGLAAPAAQ